MMKEELNVWGKSGCERPDGGRCTACCTEMLVWDGSADDMVKMAGIDCDYQRVGEGCSVFQSEVRPKCCGVFHCSRASESVRRKLVRRAGALGEVTEAEMEAALKGLGERGLVE